MDHALLVGISVAIGIIMIPVVMLTRIGWEWMVSKYYETSHLKHLQRAMAMQQRQMANEAHMSMVKSKCRNANELRRLEIERASIERQANAVSGNESQAVEQLTRDRDGLQRRVEELEQENRRLGDRAALAEETMHESQGALDQAREECHRLDKMIADLRGESVITRSRG